MSEDEPNYVKSKKFNKYEISDDEDLQSIHSNLENGDEQGYDNSARAQKRDPS